MVHPRTGTKGCHVQGCAATPQRGPKGANRSFRPSLSRLLEAEVCPAREEHRNKTTTDCRDAHSELLHGNLPPGSVCRRHVAGDTAILRRTARQKLVTGGRLPDARKWPRMVSRAFRSKPEHEARSTRRRGNSGLRHKQQRRSSCAARDSRLSDVRRVSRCNDVTARACVSCSGLERVCMQRRADETLRVACRLVEITSDCNARRTRAPGLVSMRGGRTRPDRS